MSLLTNVLIVLMVWLVMGGGMIGELAAEDDLRLETAGHYI
jgi:hypothetical protein